MNSPRSNSAEKEKCNALTLLGKVFVLDLFITITTTTTIVVIIKMVETMVSDSHFQSQLASIMEMLAKTAVLEIGKLVEESHAVFRRELSRRISENEGLKKKCSLLESELKASRRSTQDRAEAHSVPNKGRIFISFSTLKHSQTTPTTYKTSHHANKAALGPSTVAQTQVNSLFQM